MRRNGATRHTRGANGAAYAEQYADDADDERHEDCASIKRCEERSARHDALSRNGGNGSTAQYAASSRQVVQSVQIVQIELGEIQFEYRVFSSASRSSRSASRSSRSIAGENGGDGGGTISGDGAEEIDNTDGGSSSRVAYTYLRLRPHNCPGGFPGFGNDHRGPRRRNDCWEKLVEDGPSNSTRATRVRAG